MSLINHGDSLEMNILNWKKKKKNNLHHETYRGHPSIRHHLNKIHDLLPKQHYLQIHTWIIK